MTIYAKTRKKPDMNHYGKTMYLYVLEVRDISPNAEIKSKILDDTFYTPEQAAKFAQNNNYQLTKTWRLAEQKELLYRDGTQNIYRSRALNAQWTEERQQEADDAWFKMFPKDA